MAQRRGMTFVDSFILEKQLTNEETDKKKNTNNGEEDATETRPGRHMVAWWARDRGTAGGGLQATARGWPREVA